MNLRLFTHTLPLSMFAASLFAVPVAEAETVTLDGRVFLADAGVKGKAADEKDDVISFANGRFHSSSCDQWGYDRGAYKVSSAGDAVSFEAETNSEKYGTLLWKGTVRGTEIEGTFMQYPKPGLFNAHPAPIEHWFKGRART